MVNGLSAAADVSQNIRIGAHLCAWLRLPAVDVLECWGCEDTTCQFDALDQLFRVIGVTQIIWLDQRVH